MRWGWSHTWGNGERTRPWWDKHPWTRTRAWTRSRIPIFQSEQQSESDPGPEKQPDSEQVSEPNRPQRVRQPPRMFTYNTLGQPTICSVQTGPNLVPGWCYQPFQPPWMLPTHQYHAPPCYVPLVYPPYMQIMYAWCIQINGLFKTLNDVVVEQIFIVLFVELLVFSFVLPCLLKVI